MILKIMISYKFIWWFGNWPLVQVITLGNRNSWLRSCKTDTVHLNQFWKLKQHLSTVKFSKKKWIIYFKINMVILSMKSNRLFYDKGKCAKIMYDLRAPITNLDRINSSKELSWHKLILKALRMKLQNPLPFLKYSPSTYNSNYGTCPKFDS